VFFQLLSQFIEAKKEEMTRLAKDFEGGGKWKLSQAKKVALRVSSSKLDFEAWEIWHQKVRLVKLFSSERHANGDILETLHHYQYSTYTLTCLNSLLSDQSCEVY
jgi:hypothetical protein